jgi:hypothetical protein
VFRCRLASVSQIRWSLSLPPIEQIAARCLTAEIRWFSVRFCLHLVSEAAHALAFCCLTPESCFAVPKLRPEFLALALVDICDCGVLVGYKHREISTQDLSGRVGDPDTYAVRFCAFRLRCAGVKGPVFSDVAR